MSEKPFKYTVYLTKTAQKDYESIRDSKLKRGIDRTIEQMQEDPFQFKKLSGPFADLRSAKTFSFRVLYKIENEKLIVWIVAIDNRKDVYR